jgi:hypothetical protein
VVWVRAKLISSPIVAGTTVPAIVSWCEGKG